MVVKVVLLQLEGVIVSFVWYNNKSKFQLSSDPGSNFRTLRSCYYFMIAHLLEYLPNNKLSTAIGFQRMKVTGKNQSYCLTCRIVYKTRDHVASLIERFKTLTEIGVEISSVCFFSSFSLEVRHLTPCVESACFFFSAHMPPHPCPFELCNETIHTLYRKTYQM